jgi:chromate transporter
MDNPSPQRVPFAEALRFWVKLGLISFGGPAGQIALMHRELVEKRRWLSEERFLHALNYCMLLPGPEAQQLATYIGWLMHRTWGGIVAGAFFIIPSVFVLLLLSYIYAAYGNAPAVIGALNGFKPVVVAVVVEAILKIGGRALKRRVSYLIAAAAFAAIYWFHVPFPLIVLAAGFIGLAIGAESKAQSLKPKVQSEAPTVIDDHAPPPAHTLPSRKRALAVLAIGVLLWLLPLLLIAGWRGGGSLHAQLYRFFSQAALVTFGGAYAVLAYATQRATASGWLTAAQSVDGLALAETTPGPLIMVLQFLGFMAAWNNPQGLSPVAGAVTGALLTTYATFLPSFVFIFLGAPYIEKLRGNTHLAAALSSVTAAVAGVIFNLAVVFGLTVIYPQGLAGGVNRFALVLSAASFAALYKFKIDALWVVLAAGAIGLARIMLF